jgi:uncharacterized membrane protein required for colicin V production
MTFAIVETQGSATWQWIFLAVAFLWLVISTARGWSKGVMRQLVSVVALIAAVWVTSRFSSNLADYLRTALHFPEGIVTLVAILFLWIVTSNLIVLIGHIVFKKTRDQESPTAEWIYGLGGAFLGFLYGLFFLWLIMIGIRLAGYVAEKELSVLVERGAAVAFPATLAKLKNSIEHGAGGPILNAVDPIPQRLYREIDQWERAVSDPKILRKMMEYPGFQNVWRDPRVKALQDDPEIQAAAHQGNLIALMSNRKVLALMNDPEIRKAFSPEQLQEALDYALNSP